MSSRGKYINLSGVMERKLVNFTTERPLSSPQYVSGNFRKQNSGNFHEGSNSDCHNLLIYCNTVLTKKKSRRRPRPLHKKVQHRC